LHLEEGTKFEFGNGGRKVAPRGVVFRAQAGSKTTEPVVLWSPDRDAVGNRIALLPGLFLCGVNAYKAKEG
jgi:hypothetical protein